MTSITNDANQAIIETLQSELLANHVGVVDNSWQHAGHQSSGSHLVITIVSSKFEGLHLLDRHRLVHKALQSEMENTIHALELKTYSPDEWNSQS